MGSLGVALAGDPRFDGDEGLRYPPSTSRHFSSNLLPAPCRKCGGPTWLSDDEGAVHPCCKLSWTEAGGCMACKTSDILNREQRRRGNRKIVQPSGYKGVDDELS